jgi:hypothetical protein
MSENDNNNAKLERRAAAAVNQYSSNETLPILGDKEPGQTIVKLGDQATEHVITPAPAPEKGRVFIKRDLRNQDVLREKDKIAYVNLVKQVAERMRNSGRGVVPDFPADMSAEAIGQVFADANELLKQEAASMQDSQAARREEFSRRLRESIIHCDYCGERLGWAPESEEKHLARCNAYKTHLKEEQEKEAKRRLYTHRFENIFKEIVNAKNRHEFKEATAELNFARAEALSTQDPIILKIVEDGVDKRVSSESESSVGGNFKEMNMMKVIELRALADEIESWMSGRE